MGDFEENVLGESGESTSNNVDSLPTDTQLKIRDLERWLTDFWDASRPETLRKAAAYGSADLELIGQAMLLLLPTERRDKRLGLLLGISFYLTGKVARIFGQIERGEIPDQDSFYDAAIYSIMALRVQQEGKWL